MHKDTYTYKREFVESYLSPCLHAANNNLTCEYAIGEEIELKPWEMSAAKVIPAEEYVVVTCNNGHRYFVSVTASSLPAIAKEVFEAMVCK